MRAAAFVLAMLVIVGCGGDDTAPETAATTPTPTATPTVKATPAPGECDEVTYEPTEPAQFRHPESNFYEPDATNLPAKEDLDHLQLYDNAVVVAYAADTPRKTRERLYKWTYEDVKGRTPVVVPDDSPDALAVRARLGTFELRCNGIDWKRLTAFANRTDVTPRAHEG